MRAASRPSPTSATPRAASRSRKDARRSDGGSAPAQHAHRARRGERRHELDLDRVELEVVGDQHVGPVEPARAGEALARGGERGVTGSAVRPVERAVEAAVRGGRGREQARVAVLGRGRRPRPAPRRAAGAIARRGAAPRASARAPPRPAPAGAPSGRRRPAPPVSASSRAASERVVAARPTGAGPRPSRTRLGERAREVERLQRVDAGERAAGRGEPARQLDGRGAGRDEEDERAQAHGAGDSSTARSVARARWAIIAAMDPLVRLEAYLDWLVEPPDGRAQPRPALAALRRRPHAPLQPRAAATNDAGQMAAALTYRTIFGLVPAADGEHARVPAVRGHGQPPRASCSRRPTRFFNYQVDPSRPEAAAFKTALDERIFDVVKTVSGLSFETIGAVGALLLIWAALGLLVSFEDAANRIYRAPRGRRWLDAHRHLLDRADARADPAAGACSTPREFWLSRAEALPVVGPALRVPRRSSARSPAASLALALLYKLLPNTLVRWRPAARRRASSRRRCGTPRSGRFGLYVSRALPYLKLYGAIGLIPLFLFWLYLNWLIVLFGLEIAFTLQAMKRARLRARRPARARFWPPTRSGCCRSSPRSRAARATGSR